MEIFRQILLQICLVGGGILVGLAPSFFEFRAASPSGVMKITMAGWIYIFVCIAFFVMSVYALYDAKRTEIKKNSEDLLAEKENALTEATERGRLQGRFDALDGQLTESKAIAERLERQNIEILSAITKSGYEYDSAHERIIAKASEGFRFTDQELSSIVDDIANRARTANVKCVYLFLSTNSNGNLVLQQISEALKKQGISNHGGGTTYGQVNGIVSQGVQDECLQFVIGALSRQ